MESSDRTAADGLLDLAGAVQVPAEVRGRGWAQIREEAWQQRAEELTR